MLQIQFALLSGIYCCFCCCLYSLYHHRRMSQADETLNCSWAAKVCWLPYIHTKLMYKGIGIYAHRMDVYGCEWRCVGVVRAMCCLLVTMDTIPHHHVIISILMWGIFAFFFSLYYPYLNIFVAVHLWLYTENENYCWTKCNANRIWERHIKWNDKNKSLHIPYSLYVYLFFFFSHFSISSVYYSGNFIV